MLDSFFSKEGDRRNRNWYNKKQNIGSLLYTNNITIMTNILGNNSM
jgi:hypothetical protein